MVFKKSNKSSGFVLAEVMVVATISVLVLGVLYGSYIVSSKAYRRYLSQAELAQNARIALERTSRDIRQAERIITNLPPNDSDPFNPPSSEIQFQDGHDTTNVRYIRYFLLNNELHRQIIHYYFSASPDTWVYWNATDNFGDPPLSKIDEDSIKADKVSSLEFFGNKIISMEISVSDNTDTYQFSTETLGRNIQ